MAVLLFIGDYQSILSSLCYRANLAVFPRIDRVTKILLSVNYISLAITESRLLSADSWPSIAACRVFIFYSWLLITTSDARQRLNPKIYVTLPPIIIFNIYA